MPKNICLLLITLSSFTSCISNRSVPAQIFINEGYCKISPSSFSLYDSLITARISSDTVLSKEAISRFSKTSRSVAADMGILSLLTKFAQAEDQSKKQVSPEIQLRMLGIRQEIAERIALVSAEVTSVLSEINCEQDRSNELKNYLQAQIDKRERSLTIFSVLAGAIGSTLGGVFSLSRIDEIYAESVEISGAAVSAYLAIRSMKKKDIKAEFVHKRNHLADIEANPAQSNIYPPMVWHFLTKENEVSEQTPVIRKTILHRWQELNLLTEADVQEQKNRIKLIFGEGGKYSIEDISNRISLMDLLETEVSMMNQELKQLQQELLLGYHPKE